MSGGLAKRFNEYSAWRDNVAGRAVAYRNWLDENELSDAHTEAQIDQLLTRIADDKLTIAFVAEFSRGKSELINALFFSDYGRRLLPSSAGRTTMCPTELHWEPNAPPSIRLLPIETRAEQSDGDLQRDSDQWLTIPLELSDIDAMVGAFQRVRDTKRVSLPTARSYGLCNDEPPGGNTETADSEVEVPCWRYAVINFPHPLLQQGVVILDTPGLNAIGTEPELTINLLPNAHAVVFVLACDTGVTQTDAEVWQRHLAVAPGRHATRMVVLNKIDTLWDGMRSPTDIDGEIDKQMRYTADTLRLPRERIFAASAQKGLLAKITNNETLLKRSRLAHLEQRLADDLISRKQQIVRESARYDVSDLLVGTRTLLDTRLHGVQEQLNELRGLRGRNLDVVEEMMLKVRDEKEDFEQALRRFQALRNVYSQQTNRLFTSLGMEALNEETKRALAALRERWFSPGLKAAMLSYFTAVRQKLNAADKIIREIQRMMDAMYRQFTVEHGLQLSAPVPFSAYRYLKEFERLEAEFQTEFDKPLVMLTHEKMALTQKFFGTVARQMQRMYQIANRDVEAWLRAIMSPLEKQIREHQVQLRRRLDSIKRIHHATDQLEDRVAELEQQEDALMQQLEALRHIAADMERTLDASDAPLAAAA
ncbi:MAG TPA: dynamin family protein [Burkholderiales bacterium]